MNTEITDKEVKLWLKIFLSKFSLIYANFGVYYLLVAEMQERLSVNQPTILYSYKSVKYRSLALEIATCGYTYFRPVILVTPKA